MNSKAKELEKMVICFYSAARIIHFQVLKKPHLIKNVTLVF